jgi:hypothetical protein
MGVQRGSRACPGSEATPPATTVPPFGDGESAGGNASRELPLRTQPNRDQRSVGTGNDLSSRSSGHRRQNRVGLVTQESHRAIAKGEIRAAGMQAPVVEGRAARTDFAVFEVERAAPALVRAVPRKARVVDLASAED